MHEIPETLAFLKTLSVNIWQTYKYPWTWFINWSKDPHVPVDGYPCLQSGLVNLEY